MGVVARDRSDTDSPGDKGITFLCQSSGNTQRDLQNVVSSTIPLCRLKEWKNRKGESAVI